VISNSRSRMPVSKFLKKAFRASQWCLLTLSTSAACLSMTNLSNSTAYCNDNLEWRRDNFCGINSAYMFLRLHGKVCDYNALANEIPPADGPLSLFDLKTLITKRGVGCSIYSAKPESLNQVSLPFIAHVELESDRIINYNKRGHFVLIFAVKGDSILYLDGTTAAIRTTTSRKFERIWSSYILVRDEPLIHRSSPYLIATIFLLIGGILIWKIRVGQNKNIAY